MATPLYSPVISLPVPYIQGWVHAWASNTTLTVSPGTGWIQDPRSLLYTFSATTSTTITVNAAVNGVNGLDTGALVASTFYYLYEISDAQGFNVPAFMLSASPTAPVMPNGNLPNTTYNIFRLIGYVLTDSSAHFLLFYVEGTGAVRTHWWDQTILVLAGGASTTYANFDMFTTNKAVPVIDNMGVYVQANYTGATAGDAARIVTGGSTATNGNIISCQVNGLDNSGQFKVLSKLVAGVPSLAYKVSSGSDALVVLLAGFDYYL